MDPLSFVILRRIAAKIADGIDKLLELHARLTLQWTPKELNEQMNRKEPGAPGYLPRKDRDAV